MEGACKRLVALVKRTHTNLSQATGVAAACAFLKLQLTIFRVSNAVEVHQAHYLCEPDRFASRLPFLVAAAAVLSLCEFSGSTILKLFLPSPLLTALPCALPRLLPNVPGEIVGIHGSPSNNIVCFLLDAISVSPCAALAPAFELPSAADAFSDDRELSRRFVKTHLRPNAHTPSVDTVQVS